MMDSIDTGTLHDRPDLLASIEDITSLMGYDHINKLESRYMLEEDIKRRYGSDKADYVERSKH
jgi:hypothetical protein